LVFSLTLIVAIAVGFLARRAEMAHERDASLVAAAEVGAAQLAGTVAAIEVAANSGTSVEAAATAVVSAHPEIGVCAVGPDAVQCAGEGPPPEPALVDRERAELVDRLAGDDDAASSPGVAAVDSYESNFTVTVAGPAISLIARAPIDIVDGPSSIAVWAATFLPSGTTTGDFAVDRGIRQTAARVDVDAPVWVVAATEDGVRLPLHEQRFYVVISGLALTLMLLAGVTLFVEQRNLLERASFDLLTKLPNRSEFERRAAEAIANAERQDAGVCLLLFDLNGFKLVNDTYGHFAGDEMLRVVATRLRKAVREGDIVARWGGDEFVVVMPGIATDEMGAKRAHQLAEQIAGRTRLEGVSEALRVKVSVGVAIWPRHGTELSDLVESADQAMYQAKREGATWRVAEEPAAPNVQRVPA
jgi:diguanylate cyclase (GGDEF)-like protein